MTQVDLRSVQEHKLDSILTIFDISIDPARLMVESAFIAREKGRNLLQLNYNSGNILKIYLTLEYGDTGKIIGIAGLDANYGKLAVLEHDLIQFNGITMGVLFDDEHIGIETETSTHINKLIEHLVTSEIF